MKRLIFAVIIIASVFTGLFVSQDSLGRVLSAGDHAEMGMGCEDGVCEGAQAQTCAEHCLSSVIFSSEASVALPLTLAFAFACLLAILVFKLPRSDNNFLQLDFALALNRRLALLTVRRE